MEKCRHKEIREGFERKDVEGSDEYEERDSGCIEESDACSCGGVQEEAWDVTKKSTGRKSSALTLLLG